MKYPTDKYTWGYEIEWGDIDRTIEIPPHLGTWEYAEIDIVNIHEPYKYVAVDPLGIDPPMGGEINTKPTRTWQEQVDRIMEIHQLFVDNGNSPSCAVINAGHVHVYVPELKNDIDALKRLMSYIKVNQHKTVESVYGYRLLPEMEKLEERHSLYLQNVGGRIMSDEICDGIIEKSENFDDFIKYYHPPNTGDLRYAINAYCMQYTGTIEFRCFWASTDRKEISDQFRFVERFMDAALNGGPNVEQILSEYDYTFPPFKWNEEEHNGWVETIYPKERGTKNRKYYEVV